MFYSNMNGKAVIITAPSGAGKTTVVKHLLGLNDLKLEFSISSCTRPIRTEEANGRDYFFISVDQFKDMIDDDAFIEWEEVYKNSYYGTLKSEVDRIWKMQRNVLFDVDVMGAINLKNKFRTQALAIFIMPPSTEILRKRLEERGTESDEKIQKRMNKAALELKYAKKFDVILINDNLEYTLTEAVKIVTDFLKKS
jgi:guanylate kinase